MIDVERKKMLISRWATRCQFSEQLFRETGAGGRCLQCRGNRDGAKCEVGFFNSQPPPTFLKGLLGWVPSRTRRWAIDHSTVPALQLQSRGKSRQPVRRSGNLPVQARSCWAKVCKCDNYIKVLMLQHICTWDCKKLHDFPSLDDF